MEGPRVFFAAVLRDPLSEVTRKERVYLLGSSILGIAILKTGLVPTRITALGIELAEGNQEAILSLLGLVVLYFLAAFVVYATSDFLAWWEGYQAALHEDIAPVAKFLDELIEQSDDADALDEPSRREVRERLEESMPSVRRRERTRRTVLVATIRALLEYVLPVLVGAYP